MCRKIVKIDDTLGGLKIRQGATLAEFFLCSFPAEENCIFVRITPITVRKLSERIELTELRPPRQPLLLGVGSGKTQCAHPSEVVKHNANAPMQSMTRVVQRKRHSMKEHD